jgi:glyoxylase-like metal-dependent hydrolase (beta-lactamase superfamily II)
MQPFIEEISYFACGSCTNHLHWMFMQAPQEPRVFPAGVFLIKHRTQGYILYDTGYSTALYQNQFKYLLYRKINPIQVSFDEMIDQQLRQKGIEPSAIRWVILSHLHPDHIGGAKQFPKATFITTEAVYRNFKKATVKDLIFNEFLPNDFEERVIHVLPNQHDSQFPYHAVADLFGDGSLLLSSFDGHAVGQGCLFLPEKNLFLAADICWGMDLLSKTEQLKPIPRLIQHNMRAYRQSCALLQKIQADGIQVVVSHDATQRIKEVLA